MVDKSEKFSWLVRLGFAARGVVYTLLGYIFLTSSGDSGEGGAKSAFAWIQDMPAGTPILYLCALGLFGYALYRLASPAFDIENYGSDGKGWVHRIGHAASGVAHLALAYSAFKFASGAQQSASGGDTAKEVAGGILSMDFGGIVLGLVGVCFLIAGAAQAKKAYDGSFMKRISAAAPGMTKLLGHMGYAARAVVFAVIGYSLVKAGFMPGDDEIKTLGGAVLSLRDDGPWFTLVAGGLLLFGIFSLVLARYRSIPDLGANGKVPNFG